MDIAAWISYHFRGLLAIAVQDKSRLDTSCWLLDPELMIRLYIRLYLV